MGGSIIFTDMGFSVIRNWMIGTTPSTAPTHIAFGIDSGDCAWSNTSLGSEIPNSRESFSATNIIPKQIEFEHYLGSAEPSGETSPFLREIGLFNSATYTGGQLFYRDVFPELEKTTSIELQSILVCKIV